MSTKVFAKLLELQKTVRALQRDKSSYGFDYLSGNKLLEVVRPRMDELGLLLLPNITGTVTTPVQYPAWDKNARMLVNKVENLVAVDIEFTWVDVESGETYTSKWHGTGQNGFDKGFGSALTYAERYYLLKLFHIQTDRDDVDALARERDEAIEKGAAAVAEAQAAAAAPVNTPAAPKFPTVEALRQDKEFWQWVEAAALGKSSKAGRPAREAFIMKYLPTKPQLDEFDCAVDDRKEVLRQQAEIDTRLSGDF